MTGGVGECEGRIALVTGASRGIGAAIAERLAAAGARVACVARSLDEPKGKQPGSLRETVERIHSAGGRAVAIQGDVARAESRIEMVEKCLAELGSIDILVNNAAAGPHKTFEKLTAAHFALTFGVNVEAAFHLTQLTAPAMRARGRGFIVNISSASARHPVGPPFDAYQVDGGVHLYAASKAALDRLSIGLAAELSESGVVVNTLAPVAAVITAAVRMTGADA